MGGVEGKGFFIRLGDSAEWVVFELCGAASLVAALGEVAGFVVAVAAGEPTLGPFDFAVQFVALDVADDFSVQIDPV
ncbi:hypothetical protein [Neisseria zalophi]|uniref:hypothetical protein n=1 Tax=Neisseria zalophi TaxID=640030 RepID=UPI00384EC84E